MLFRKKITPACSYCEYATKLDDEQILCVKKGIRPIDGKCSNFFYDPCKRIPSKQKALDFSSFEDKDYSL